MKSDSKKTIFRIVMIMTIFVTNVFALSAPVKAYANPVIVGDAAYGFLEAAAIESGMTVGDFIATVAGVGLTTTGMSIANQEGVKLGNSASQNLENLLEAADYPDWSTLSSEDQTAWGSKQNYDAAKLNAFLDAFGYGEDRDEYYSSGGANFEFSEDVSDSLKRLGRIGKNWGSGIGNLAGNIVSLITDRNAVDSYFPTSSSGLTYDATDIDDWPTSISRNLVLGYGSEFLSSTKSGNTISAQAFRYGTSLDVYYLIFVNSNNAIELAAFSKSSFGYRRSSTASFNSAQTETYSGNTFYCNIQSGIPGYNPSMPVNYAGSYPDLASIKKACGIILFGDKKMNGGTPDKIEDYPEDGVDPSQRVYMPDNGVTNNNNWNTYLQPVTINRPTNNYNPGQDTSTPEWRDDTTANMLPLVNVHFEDLFPFCLLYDVRSLFDKVQGVTGGEAQSGAYQRVTIPVKVGNAINETIVLDLKPLYDLLILVRPFVQILLAAGLLFVTIEFWKGILTG